jgi:hypothetical protein
MAKRVIDDNQPGVKVFYWSDTGPVECKIEDGWIVRAEKVEAKLLEVGEPFGWHAGVGVTGQV